MRLGNFINKKINTSSVLFKEAEGDEEFAMDDTGGDTSSMDTTTDINIDTGDEISGDTGASIDEMSDPMAGLDEHSMDMDDLGMDDSTFDMEGIDTSEGDIPDIPDKDDEDAKRRITIKNSFIALFDKYTQIVSELKALEFPLEFDAKIKPIISEYDRLLRLVDEYIAMYVSVEKVIILLKTFVETRATFDILDNQLSSIKDDYIKFINEV